MKQRVRNIIRTSTATPREVASALVQARREQARVQELEQELREHYSERDVWIKEAARRGVSDETIAEAVGTSKVNIQRVRRREGIYRRRKRQPGGGGGRRGGRWSVASLYNPQAAYGESIIWADRNHDQLLDEREEA